MKKKEKKKEKIFDVLIFQITLCQGVRLKKSAVCHVQTMFHKFQ